MVTLSEQENKEINEKKTSEKEANPEALKKNLIEAKEIKDAVRLNSLLAQSESDEVLEQVKKETNETAKKDEQKAHEEYEAKSSN